MRSSQADRNSSRHQTTEVFPLTPLQEAMVLSTLGSASSGPYIQQLICPLRAGVDRNRLQAAWQRVVDHHEVLRTVISVAGGELSGQFVLPNFEVSIADAAAVTVPSITPDGVPEQFLEADLRRGIDNWNLPAWRLTWIGRGTAVQCLVWTSHHALFDGRSRRAILNDLLTAYSCPGNPAEARLMPRPPFRRHCEWLAQRRFDRSREYWTQSLGELAEVNHWPAGADVSGPASPGPRHRTVTLTFDESFTRELRNLADSAQVTFNTVVQGAWAILAGWYSGTEIALFGAPRACRHSSVPGADAMVGLLVNTVPVRVRMTPQQRLRPWLQQIRADWNSQRPHEQTPLSLIRSWCDVPPGNPFLSTLVACENARLADDLGTADERCPFRDLILRGSTDYPLVISATLGQCAAIELTYDSARVATPAVEHLKSHLLTLFTSMVGGQEQTLRELRLLSEPQQQQLVIEWNDTSRAWPQTKCVVQLFEEQVARTPQAIAVVQGETQVCYAELNRRANRLAHELRRRGVTIDEPVALIADRSFSLIAGLLGVLKSGGAYVPLDPAMPLERNRVILRKTGARCLLASPRQATGLSDLPACILDLEEWTAPGVPGSAAQNPPIAGTPERLAYIMFTSGSAGLPKGVCIPHRGIVRLLCGVDYARFGPGHSILQMAPPAFDAATFEIWGALLHGGRCVLYPGQLPDFEVLAETLRNEQIDTLWLTSALFNAVIDSSPGMLAGVRQLLVGGEALSVPHVRRALELLPTTQIMNGYGPTEATTFACCFAVPRDLPADCAAIPIGGPIANTTVHLVDGWGRLVPPGAPGEVLIGGPGLARGYLNDSQLTAQRFVPDPFEEFPQSRLYRTGDLACRSWDGTLTYRGRLDDQVKIRGHRVEPAEVAARLRQHPALRDVFVLAIDAGARGGKSLTAFLVPAGTTRPTVEELRRFVREMLPEPFLPGEFHFVEELPRTTLGKIDRRRLIAMAQPVAAPRTEFVEPRSTRELILAAIFGELLQLPRVGINDDFFASGGHSLLAMQAVARIRQELGVELPLNGLFAAPTVAELAALVDRLTGGGTGNRLSTIPVVPRGGRYPILASQYSIFEIAREFPRCPWLNTSRAYRVEGPLDCRALGQSLNELSGRHEALRSTLGDDRGSPCQIIHAIDEVQLKRIDLTGLPASERFPAAQRAFWDEAQDPFDLTCDRLLRAILLTLDTNDHVLIVTLNHFVMDGESLTIFNRELAALYSAQVTGRPADLPVLPIQPVDLACWEREFFRTPEAQRQIDYWQSQIGSVPPVEGIPGDGPAPVPGNYRSHQESRLIDQQVTDRLRAIAREERCTLPMALLAAVYLFAYHTTGREELLVGTPLASRTRPELAAMITCLRKRLVLHTSLAGRPGFRELLRRVRRAVTGAHSNLDVSQEIAFPGIGLAHPNYWANIPFDFNFMPGLGHALTLPGLKLTPVDLPENLAGTAALVHFGVSEQSGGLLLRQRTRHGYYSPSQAAEFASLFLQILSRAAARPDEFLDL